MEISVIMGVYNQMDNDVLSKAIHSILNQNYKDFEFIIYDDGSCEKVELNLKEFLKVDKRIKVIRRDENNGLAFSLNTCLKFARGKYIARMDSDDISKLNRLMLQHDFLENNPEYGWVSCNAELIDENGVWGYRKMPEIPSEKDFLKYSPYIHPAVMYRKSTLDEIGGYNQSECMMRCEDYEIFMRLHQNGKYGYNMQDYLFQYRENQNSYSKRKVKFRYNEFCLRYRNFKKMNLLSPLGMIYTMRPLAGIIIPNKILFMLKSYKSIGETYNVKKTEGKVTYLQEKIAEESITL